MTDQPTFDWLTPEQQAQLAVVDHDWRTWLPAQLDQYWPDWREATDESRISYVDHLLPTLTMQVADDEQESSALPLVEDGVWTADEHTEADPGAAESNPADLAWVTLEQRTTLDSLTSTRGHWYEWLPYELDAAWPHWRESTGDVLASWFETVWPGIAAAETAAGAPGEGPAVPAASPIGEAATAPTYEAGPDAASPTSEAVIQPEREPAEAETSGAPTSEPPLASPPDLSWVSAHQAARLDALGESRGDWRDWLPTELDAIGNWRGSAPEDLVPWLDLVIPSLAFPAAPYESAGTAPVVGNDVDDVESDASLAAAEDAPVAAAEQWTATLAEALATEPEMAELAARLTADELAELVNDALVMAGNDARGDRHE